MKPDAPNRVALDISTSQLPPHTIALWWLGQASIVLKSGEAVIYIDPFLSRHPDRLVPPPFMPEEAAPADYVLCTHEHLDHLDAKTLPGLMQSSSQAHIIVPYPIKEQVTACGIVHERVLSVQPDEEIDFGTWRLFPVAAMHGLKAPPAHYSFDLVEQGKQHLYRYLGYVIEMAGIRIYHAGDTLVYDGLVERLRQLKIDIALLPINGRSYFREQQNLVGNMDEREAADLVAAAEIPLLIPIHYGGRYRVSRQNFLSEGRICTFQPRVYPLLFCKGRLTVLPHRQWAFYAGSALDV